MSLTLAVAYMFEHRISKFLESSMDDFVQGTEGAILDCGLVTGAPFICPPGIDQVHIARLDRAIAENRQVVPLDFKTSSPSIRPYNPHATRYDINISASQEEHCAGFIFMNPTAPDWVAVIPAAYIAPRYTAIPRYEDGTPAFSIRWLPFVVPLRMLCQALSNFKQFCEKKQAA